jgi:hypothetical protein
LALARGEDQLAYTALHQAITDDIGPRDAIETAFTQAIVDHIWAIRRWRMIEASLLADFPQKDQGQVRNRGEFDISHLLRRGKNQPPLQVQTNSADATPPSAPMHQEGASRKLEPEPGHRRRASPTSADPAAARTALLTSFQKYTAPLEQAARLRVREEAQRDAAIRDLDRYRATTRQSAVLAIEDAEFTEVTADGVNPKTRGQSAQRAEKHRSPHPGRTRPRKQQRA